MLYNFKMLNQFNFSKSFDSVDNMLFQPLFMCTLIEF